MRDRITILRPVYAEAAMGAKKVSYEETRTVHAERVKIRGTNNIEAGERFPDYSAEFNIRIAHHVEENWRVKQVGGYLYTVKNIIRDAGLGMITLICERVNL